MKQNLFNKLWLRVGMIVAIMTTALSGTAWAAEEVYKTALFGSSYNSQSIGSYTDTWSATNAGFTVNLANFNNNNNSWNYVKCGRKNNTSVATIITADAIDKAITKVVVTIDAITASKVNSIKLYTSSNGSSWTEAGSFTKATGAQTVNLVSPAANLYYKIEFDCASGSSNGLVTVSKVEYYYNAGGTVSPSISADDVSIAYTATSGEIAYTINNGVTGGTLSASTIADWLTPGTATSTTVPFTCTANEGAERTATVTLTYTYNTSETVTKDVIVTQALNPNGPGSEANPYTVAQARAAIDAGTGQTDVYATGIISQVDSYNGTYHSITYWISDDGTTTNQLEVYSGKGLNNTNFTSVNDVAVGATVVVYGTLKKFGETYEFDKNNYLTSYTAPAAAVEAPTFSPVAGTYDAAQNVTLSTTTTGATIYYTTDGSTPTDASTQYTSAISVSTATTIKAIAINGGDESTVSTATYHICSAASPYTVTQALAFTEYPANGIYVSGIVSTAPTQAPTNNGELTYYISDDGTTGTQLEVYKGKGLSQAAFTAQDDIQVGDIVTIYGNVKIYNNTKEFDTDNYLVSFERPAVPSITASDVNIVYDATSGAIAFTIENATQDGVLTAAITAGNEGSWLSLGTVTTSVALTCSTNEGNADRTATVTLTYTYDTNKTVTKDVTVTQTHFVVDYATLPFEFDGGRADIANTTGLTQEGLDSDYGSSPKLKFNGTGDYVILKINERPGVLKYDILGNGFSGGTFKVQTSVDGNTYTDLETYTELGSTQSEEFSNLGENVRYIKWIYTNKSSGNVALGNIALAAYVAPANYNLTVTLDDNISAIYIYDAADQTEALIEDGAAGTVQVTNGTEILVSPDVAAGYQLASLMVDGVDVTSQIDETGAYTFTMPTHAVAITATAEEYVAPSGDQYALYSGDLVEGDYIVVYEGKAMNTTVTSDRLQYAEVTSANNVITTDNAAIVWHIAPSGNYWTIYNADANAYAASTGAKNKAQMLADGTDDMALWTVSGTETYDFVNVKNTANEVNAHLRNNGTYGFACYATSTGGALTLYKKVVPTESVTVTAAGYATFASDNALDFTGKDIKAYIATTNGTEGVNFTQINKVPANTGVLLVGTEGQIVNAEVPRLTGNTDATTGNVFVPGTGAAVASEGTDVKNYVLSSTTTYGVGFYPASDKIVAVGKAYISVPKTTLVKGFIMLPGLDDDATGISLMEDGRSQIEDGVIYNIAGQRISKMQKGINIVNGKKILK